MSLPSCTKDGSSSVNTMTFGSGDKHGWAVLERMRYQRETKRFCDVCIVVGDRRFDAHRMVLAANSPYFDSILKHSVAVKEKLVVNCRDPTAFEHILNFMYSGTVVIDRRVCAEMLRLANNLLMVRLKHYCAEYLERYLDTANCLGVRDLAERFNLHRLVDKANAFLETNVSACLLDSPDVLEFKLAQIIAILAAQKAKNAISAEAHLCLIVRWVSASVPQREEHFSELLGTWRASEMAPHKLEMMIDHNPLFVESELSLYSILRAMSEAGLPLGVKYERRYWDLSNRFQPVQRASTDDNDSTCNQFQQTTNMNNSTSQRREVEGVQEGGSKEALADGHSNELARPSLKIKIHLSQSVSVDGISEEMGRHGKERKLGLKQYRKSVSSAGQTLMLRKRGRPPKVRVQQEPADEEAESQFHNFPDDSDVIVLFDEQDEVSPEEMAADGGLSLVDQDGASSPELDNPDPISLQCPHCPHQAKSQQKLKRHKAVVHSAGITYVCSLCQFECRWNRLFYDHMRQEHFKGPPHQCDLCTYSVDRINVLLSHRLTHSADKPFKCADCNFRARSRANLIIHARYHSGERPFECMECGKSFAIKSTFEQHAVVHSDVRPYACSECDFTAKYQSHLISHRRIHSGNLYRCEVEGCSYSSPKKSQLAAHLRTHLALRSHQCSQCRRTFIEKSHLIRHQRIHLRDKPFKCDNCEYTSSRRDKLKEHILKHHTPATNARQHKRRYRRARQLAQLIAQAKAQQEELPPNPKNYDFRPIPAVEAEEELNEELEQIQRQSDWQSGLAQPLHQQHPERDRRQREEQRRQQQVRCANGFAHNAAAVQPQPSQFGLLPQQSLQPGVSGLNRPSSASLPQNNPAMSFSPSCFSLHDFHMHAAGDLVFGTTATPDSDHTELTTPVDPQVEQLSNLMHNPHSVGFHNAIVGGGGPGGRYSFAHQMTFDHSQMSEIGEPTEQDLHIPRPLSLPNYGGIQQMMGGGGGVPQIPQSSTLDGQNIPHQSQTCWSLHGGDPSMF